MIKAVKIVGGFFTTIIVIVVVIPMFLSLIMQDSSVQSWIVRKFTNYISNKTGMEVSVGRIDVGRFYSIHLDDVFVESPIVGDTLLYAKDVEARIATFRSLSKGLFLDDISVDGGEFNMYVGDDSVSNIKYFIEESRNKLSKKRKKNKADSVKGSYEVKITNIDIENFVFRLKRETPEVVTYGINYQDMEMSSIDAEITDFYLKRDSMTMVIDALSMREKGGVDIGMANMERATISPNGMFFDKGSVHINNNSYVDFNTITLGYRDWEMEEYVDSVNMVVDIKKSVVDMSSVELFTKERRGWSSVFEFEGDMVGFVSSMEGSIKSAKVGDATLKDSRFFISNITKIKETIFDIKLGELVTSPQTVVDIINDFAKDSKAIILPKEIEKGSRLRVDGYLIGQMLNFDAECDIDILNGGGNIKTNININNEGRGIDIDGSIISNGVNIDKFYDFDKISNLSFKVDVDGNITDGEPQISVVGEVDNMHFNDYSYNDIELDGKLNTNTFVGYMGSSDSNLNFVFNGMLDFSDTIPSYNFNLELKRADLVALNFNKKDSISLLSGVLIADGRGDDIDNINGNIIIDSLTYINHIDSITAGLPINVTARNSETSKNINVTSEYFDLTLKGSHSYNELYTYIVRGIDSYLPSLKLEQRMVKVDEKLLKLEEQKRYETSGVSDFYHVSFNVKRVNNIAAILVPTLTLAEGSRMNFLFNPTGDSFSFNLSSKAISIQNNYLSGISINATNENSAITLFGSIKEVTTGSFYLPNFTIMGDIGGDVANIDFGFSNQQDKTYAFIKTSTSLSSKDDKLEYKIALLPSRFNLYNDVWSSNSGEITISEGDVAIKEFRLTSTDQLLKVDGVISKEAKDSLVITMDNFSFKPINIFTSKIGFDITGAVTGDIKASGFSSDSRGYIDADVRFTDSVTVNGVAVPDTRFFTERGETERDFNFFIEGSERTYIKGYVTGSTNSYFADVDIPQFKVAAVAPYLSTIAKDIEGDAAINVTVSNPNGYMEINGDVSIPSLNATIIETNVDYILSGKAEITNNQYLLKEGLIRDKDGGRGAVTAYMTNERYKKVKYNISVDTKNIMALNTTVRENTLYYGKIFAQGKMSIDGDRNKITLRADASPSKRSTFFLPLGENNLTETSFIKFAARDSVVKSSGLFKEREKVTNSAEFEMIMNLRATPLLETEIVMDPTTGSSLKATGSGAISLNIEPFNEIFDINGEYILDRGTYRFIVPNFSLLDKTFDIKSGGWMRWSGDPLDATLNVDAIFPVKASLAPLLGKSYSGRVNVECVLSMRGNLMSPDINLGLDTPDASPEERTAINDALNTQEAISTQIVYLLLSNSFYPTNSEVATEDIGYLGATTTGIEFLTNQISNIFSNDKINFGINYVPYSTQSSNEVTIDVSAPIYGDKLFIDVTGNYNFLDNATAQSANSENITGDVFLTWVVNNSRNISLKAFTKTIDTFDENQGLQDNGLGVYFKMGFDTWQDLKLRYRDYVNRLRENRKIKKQRKAEAKANTIRKINKN